MKPQTAPQSVQFSARALQVTRALWGALLIFSLVVWLRAVQVTYPVWFEFPPEDEVTMLRAGISGNLVGSCMFALEILWALVLAGIGGIIYLRKNRELEGFLLSLAVITLLPGGSAGNQLMRSQTGWSLAAMLLDSAGLVFIIVALYSFPDGRPFPAWLRRVIPLVAAWGLLSLGLNAAAWAWGEEALPFAVVALLQTGGGLILGGLGIYAQVRRYRAADDALLRRQIRTWMWGVGIALVSFAAYNAWHVLFFPALGSPPVTFWRVFLPFELLYTLGMLCIPLFLAGALLRRA